MGARHTRLAAALAAAWEAEVVSARRMTALAERIADARVRARLMVLAAFCRAHASRLLARLAALGRGPLPVPPEDIELDSDTLLELRREGPSPARRPPAMRRPRSWPVSRRISPPRGSAS
ncbi:hypothetical protein QEG98_18050 [Myxococcus sp. MxC21-1]|uniref:hypothetical protein n=1 Tax=Myxococcus sp. MxC21-1 TaxID=3041439 RepID=UPI00292D7634|nr:hypothetical protein [Myxococcus sp. MxC21-1]WNZ65356.1 hypothetical protein QEG98_18050 [Myxococcus sp. MxC21-1]